MPCLSLLVLLHGLLLLTVLAPVCHGGGFRENDSNTVRNIVNGEDAPATRFPYMCSVRWFDDSYVCSAFLVHRRLALTAGHCVSDPAFFFEIRRPGVYCGSEKRDSARASNKFESRTRVAPCWTGDSLRGCDLALLILDRNASLPLPQLPLQHEPVPARVDLVALGFGFTSFRPAVQINDLQIATSFRKCNRRSHRGAELIYPETSICTVNPQKEDLCRGDSGGPLLLPDPSASSIDLGNPVFDKVLGLDSWGSLKCDASRPQIFSRLSSFSDWIQSVIREIEDEESMPTDTQDDELEKYNAQEGDPSESGPPVGEPMPANAQVEEPSKEDTSQS